MGFLAFLLVFGICLLVIAALIGFAAFVHKDVGGETVSIDELLKD